MIASGTAALDEQQPRVAGVQPTLRQPVRPAQRELIAQDPNCRPLLSLVHKKQAGVPWSAGVNIEWLRGCVSARWMELVWAGYKGRTIHAELTDH